VTSTLPTRPDASPLRAKLEVEGGTLADLTVLAAKNDPFRLDTPARHRDAEWLAVTAAELGLGARRIHLRGLHYMVIGRPKPDGTPYSNTDKDWEWLSENAGKAARWLGYIPFDQIVDQRNAEPVELPFVPPNPQASLNAEHIWFPDDIAPALEVDDFRGTQRYKLVLVGEKSSLQDVLRPIARAYEADLYLPTGEISDTQAHRMAKTATADGRPMEVFYFSDCDPSGWQMPVSLGRKLQAHQVLSHQVLSPSMPDFRVHRVALSPDQVRQYGLPSTPLKGTEQRADSWQAEMGVEQTEIDALASLRPDLLRQIASQALDGFFDHTLAERVFDYQGEWLDEAAQAVAGNMDADELDQASRDAESLRDDVARLNERMAALAGATRHHLPEIQLPEARDPGGNGPALLDSRWSFAEQCRRLKESKGYDMEET
jgi:hypothetical protein